MPNLEQAIKQLEEDMALAFNQRDVDRILIHFSPDLIGFSSTTHEHIQGLEALRKTFEYYLREGSRVEFSVSDIQVQDLDSAAVATFHWIVTIWHDDHSHEIPGRGSHVFIRSGEDWKVVHEHFSRAHQH